MRTRISSLNNSPAYNTPVATVGLLSQAVFSYSQSIKNLLVFLENESFKHNWLKNFGKDCGG